MYHDPNYQEHEDYLEPDELELDELEALVFDSVVPAVCVHGCEVEPDGACPHGMPSILIHMGLL